MEEEISSRLEVDPGALRRPLPAPLPATTAEIEPLDTIAGQERARKAITFGLAMTADGYNIAVSAAPSSGRTLIIHHLVDGVAKDLPAAPDWVYLHNFSDPRHPRVAALAPGTGAELQRGLSLLADTCRHALPRAFENEAYTDQREQALEPFGKQRQEGMQRLEKHAREAGFGLNATQTGILPVPLAPDGNPLSGDAFARLPEEERAERTKQAKAVQDEIQSTLRDIRRIDSEARTEVEKLDRNTAHELIRPVLDDLRSRFHGQGVDDHLDAIRDDVFANLETYHRFAESAQSSTPPQLVAQSIEEREALLRRYDVNLFVSRTDDDSPGGPVVDERHHGYRNLFGWVDYENRFGTMTTDFTRIHPGAIHRANGGFLILQLQDVFSDPRSWTSLKRALKTREARFEDPAESGIPFPVAALQPEGVPLEVKVVLVGPPQTFAIFDAGDPELAELFKVRAEFEPDVPADAENMASYVAFVRKTVDDFELLHFDASALEAIVRYGSILAGRQDRFSARYGMVEDLCHESDQTARSEGVQTVAAEHVRSAISARRARSALLPDRRRDMITEGVLRIETSGKALGQINGLAVYSVGGHEFGTPTRITCRVGAGRRGISAIERETERSGAIHTKGVLVLAGYLHGTFGSRIPLAFNASLTFEQSYEGIDGDSASSAELVALLTSLADLKIRQDIAVTGSVDQFGNVQPVGGVAQKVEGFFDVCREAGLTGSQGVVIPKTNTVNLTLRHDIGEAVESGQFHVWATSRIEETVELLCEVEAGTPGEDGKYQPNTVYGRVAAALEQMAARSPDQQPAEQD